MSTGRQFSVSVFQGASYGRCPLTSFYSGMSSIRNCSELLVREGGGGSFGKKHPFSFNKKISKKEENLKIRRN